MKHKPSNHRVDPTASGLVAPGWRLSPAVDHARRSPRMAHTPHASWLILALMGLAMGGCMSPTLIRTVDARTGQMVPNLCVTIDTHAPPDVFGYLFLRSPGRFRRTVVEASGHSASFPFRFPKGTSRQTFFLRFEAPGYHEALMQVRAGHAHLSSPDGNPAQIGLPYRLCVAGSHCPTPVTRPLLIPLVSTNDSFVQLSRIGEPLGAANGD